MNEKRMATIYDYARMCKSMKDCDDCPLSYHKDYGCELCEAYNITNNTDKVNEIILEWCDEHPVKTYKQDFLEKFPKARLDANGLPNCICVDYIYNTIAECDNDCSYCWNSPMEGSDE